MYNPVDDIVPFIQKMVRGISKGKEDGTRDLMWECIRGLMISYNADSCNYLLFLISIVCRKFDVAYR